MSREMKMDQAAAAVQEIKAVQKMLDRALDGLREIADVPINEVRVERLRGVARQTLKDVERIGA